MAVSLGFNKVYRYPEGYPEWQVMGMPTAATDLFAPANATEQGAAGAAPLVGWALIWTLVAVFVGGMALDLTPCIYPLIPITVSYFAGRAGGHKGKLVVHGLLYLAGMALANSAMGVTAAMTGGLIGALLQNSFVLIGVALVLVFFATSMFGLWEFRLPSGLTQAASKSHAGYFGSLFMGLALGVVAAPCIGPFVLGLLTWVAGVGSPWFGFLIFFTLSLGLGTPLFLLALFSGRLDRLPRSGEWMLWVRKLMGWVLVGMAVYFVAPLFPEPVRVALVALLAIGASLHLTWLDRSKAAFAAFRWLKVGVGLAALVLALVAVAKPVLRGPGVAWQPCDETVLEAARAEGKPVVLDFYATWCAPCRELDEITFHDRQVVERSADVVMMKVDLTADDNPLHRALVARYGVKGVPTLVFLDGRGSERQDLRRVEFVKPADFLALLDELDTEPTP